MDEGQLYQLRVDEDASHTITNTFTAQYGVLDNLTLSASVPQCLSAFGSEVR